MVVEKPKQLQIMPSNHTTKRAVKDVYDEVQRDLRGKKIKVWKLMKKDHFHQARAYATKSHSFHQRLPTATRTSSNLNCQNNNDDTISTLTVSHKARPNNKNKKQPTVDVQVTTSFIESSHKPLPKSRASIPQNYSYSVDDQPEMKFIPGDDDINQAEEELVQELVELGAIVKKYDFGQPHEEKRVIVDAMLKRLDERKVMPQLTSKRDGYYTSIAKLTEVDKDTIKRHHKHVAEQEEMFSNRCNKIVSKCNSDTPIKVTYEKIIDSYRDLFCRRCFTYDCNIHGNIPKAHIDLQAELQIHKERAQGKCEDLDEKVFAAASSNLSSRTYSEHDALSPVQKSICARMYLMFQGDIEKMALAMGASSKVIQSFVTSNNIKIDDPKYVTPKLLKKKGDRVPNLYVSMRNYKPEYLNKIQRTFVHPAFIPCDHDGPCNASNCSCIQNAFFCTKHCSWGRMSTNFFRGCACKAGQCRLSNCACFAAGRECDPDLCLTCGACSDPPNAPAVSQRCRNDSISMKRGVHLLIGASSVKGAGYGLFTLCPLKKGDFVDEYAGEIISQEEAERRGVVYDRQNMSYLFNLCSDLSIDATVRGNKTRYANHSDSPNIEPRLIRVNGDTRVAFYAIKDIGAEEELFFDYGYSEEIDNEQLFKPNHSHKFHWMNVK